MENLNYLHHDRVRRHTCAEVQEKIDDQTRQNIRFFGSQPRPMLNARIQELERKWDMERVLETNASILALSGAILGTTVNRRFFALTGVVLTFLAQHAISGWCPPVPLFRRLGVRTRTEIDQERYALKALRGDFRRATPIQSRHDADRLLEAVQ